MSDKSEWVWMPHAAHLIVSRNCIFYLATCVGKHIVSTVGEYLPDAPVREILARSRGIELVGRGDERLASWMKQMGYEGIRGDYKYETLVFPAINEPESPEWDCCPYRPSDWCELDAGAYNEPGAAMRGHLELCEKWAKES